MARIIITGCFIIAILVVYWSRPINTYYYWYGICIDEPIQDEPSIEPEDDELNVVV